MNTTPRRRSALMATTALATASALTLLGLSVPANAAPGDNSEAVAQFLSASSLVTGSLATVGTASAGSPTGPSSQTNPLNLAALQGLGLDLRVTSGGVTVPLVTQGTTPGLLDLGQLGAVQNYASSTPTSSVAASGLVTNDGAIALSDNAAPGTGGNATLNLTALLGQLGVAGPTADIVDSLGLEVGAVASRIQTSADGNTLAEYRVADLKANLHSALVGRLASTLRAAGVTVGSDLSASLNGLVGTNGLVTSAVRGVGNLNVAGLASVELGNPTIAVNVANLGTVVDNILGTNAILVSDGGTVTVNLTAGTVTVDLAKIVKPGPPGTGLNGLPANTSVLTGPTLTAVTNGITNALGKIAGPLATALQTAVANSTATVSVQVRATALPALGGLVLIDAPITISGTLQQLANGTGTVNTSGLQLLPGVPSCLLNVPLVGCVGNVTGLVSTVVGLVGSSVLPPVLGALSPAVGGILSTTGTTITNTLNGVVNPVVSSLNPVLTNVLGNVATITVNEQPAEGDLGPGSQTVRALSLTLLPNLAGSNLAKVALGSSTAAAVEVPTLDVVETSVREGSTINVTGAGWDPAAPVTITYTNAAGEQVGEPDVVTPAGGVFAVSQVIPVGTPGPVTATASQGAFTGPAAITDTVGVTGAPVFNVLEGAATVGTEVTATGVNWIPAQPVTIVFADAEGEVGTTTATPAADGSFTVPFTVPDVSGVITATATQGADVLTDEFEAVPEGTPILDIVETSIVAGEPVTVTGSAFDPDTTVSVVFVDADGVTLGSPVTPTTDGAGAFEFTFTVPVSAVGPVTATATQVGGDNASDSVLVTPAPVPTADIVETTVVVGGPITVNGTNWQPGTVAIEYSNAGGVIGTQADVPVGADGTFASEFTVPTSTGPGEITATVTQGSSTATDTVEASLPVIPPTFDIVETQVVAGKVITVTGANWDNSLVVGVSFVTDGPTPVGSRLVGVQPDGTFTFQFTVPADTATGPLVATADDGTSVLTDVVQVLPVPTVTILETQVLPLEDITIGGANWAPGAPVQLVYVDGDGEEIGAESVDPNAEGEIAATFTIPEGTVGPVTVTASQADNTATDVVVITVPAPGPAIDIVQTSVTAGQPIDLAGSGWSAASLVTIAFTDGEGARLPGTIQVFPLTDGSFTAAYTVPATTVGPLTATATQDGNEADDTITVIPVPLVNIVEDQVTEGEVITVEGTNWPANDIVTIAFTDGNGAPIGAPFTTPTDEAGEFETTFTVPLGTVGPITATATIDQDGASDSVAIAPAPSLDITEEVVNEGDVITITGLNFDPDAPVTLTFQDGNGDPIPGTQQFEPFGNGGFTRLFRVPMDTVGPVTVVATQNGGDPLTDFVAVEALPIVNIVEDEVVEGEEITVEGDDFEPNGTVTIAFTDGNGAPIGTPSDVPTDVDGSFTTTFTVPAGTVGPVTASVTQDGGSPVTDSVDVAEAADADVATDADAVDADAVDADVDATDADAVDADAVDADAADVDATDADVVDADAADGDATDADVVDADVDAIDADVTDADVDATDADAVDADVDAADVDATDADAVDADVDAIDADVDAADADAVDADVDAADVDATDADAVDADVDAIDADVDAADADAVDADVDAADVDAADADVDAVDVDATDADAVDADVDAIDADVDAADVDAVDADVDAADVDTTDADAVDADATDADAVDADAPDADAVDADAPDADAVDADATDADAVDADVDATDADAVDADAIDADVDATDADAVDADAVDADVDATDADAVDADAVDADVDATDADAVDADAVDADAVDVDAADADAIDADAIDADAVDADAIDADAVDADATDADATDADATDVDAVDVDATDADADGATDADADADGTPIATVLPRATVERPTVVRGTGVSQKFFGYGFQPGETVAATVYSTPIELTPMAADASGNVVFSLLIGADFELGAHRVEFVGSVSGALPQDRETTSFVVLGNPAEISDPAVLAYTGFTGMWLAGFAALLMLAGAGGLGFARRSRPRAM